MLKLLKKAKQSRTFDKVFSVKLDDDFYDDLIEYIDHKQARKQLFGDEK